MHPGPRSPVLHQPLSEIDALDVADLAELAEDAREILRARAGAG